MNVLDQHVAERFAIYNADCVEALRGLPDASVHYSISSPPFSSLYTYSASPRDLGNVADHAEFFEAFRFLVPELYRVIKPGRLISMHCMNLPTSKARDGIIGLTDFRGALIRAFIECDRVYHSEVVIWKDPVTAMQVHLAGATDHHVVGLQIAMHHAPIVRERERATNLREDLDVRTQPIAVPSEQRLPRLVRLVVQQRPPGHALDPFHHQHGRAVRIDAQLDLLHKTIRKDSAMSRQGLPDYLVTFRKPGENPEPIAHAEDGPDALPVAVWQRYASPVWVTTRGVDDEGFAVCSGETVAGDASSSIDPGDTLQHRSARDDDDERHICPLQLEVIRRAIRLWTNPGDTVLSPFAGIGSEIVTAVEMGRRGIGIELKRSYYEQAVRNLIAVSVETKKQVDMFAPGAP